MQLHIQGILKVTLDAVDRESALSNCVWNPKSLLEKMQVLEHFIIREYPAKPLFERLSKFSGNGQPSMELVDAEGMIVMRKDFHTVTEEALKQMESKEIWTLCYKVGS